MHGYNKLCMVSRLPSNNSVKILSLSAACRCTDICCWWENSYCTYITVSLSNFIIPYEPLLSNVNSLESIDWSFQKLQHVRRTLFFCTWFWNSKAYLLHLEPAINEWTSYCNIHNQVFPNEFFFPHCPAQQEYLAARFARADTFLLPDVLSSWNKSIPVLDQI